MTRWLLWTLCCALAYGSSETDACEWTGANENAKKADYIARIGVASLTPDLLSLAQKKLPIGYYKDYSSFGDHDTTLTYLPVIQYKSKADSDAARSLVTIAWQAGQFPKLPGTDLQQLLVAMNLSELEAWLLDHTGEDDIPDGTMFLLGNEPGYRLNNDDRTAKEIVNDAAVIKGLFQRLNLKHQLALGGISTPKNALANEAYNGKLGNDFFREILAEAEGEVEFDAFVVHPYPSDIPSLSAQESFDQIVEFRRIMAEYGQRDKPLIVGEVGVPFPALRNKRDEVCRYAAELLELCLTARDPEFGLASDDDLVVQRFTWYLLCAPQQPILGFTDNPWLDLEASALMRIDGTLTDIGEVFARTVNRLARPSTGHEDENLSD